MRLKEIPKEFGLTRERHWRRLNAKELIAEVIRGITFVNGIKEIAA